MMRVVSPYRCQAPESGHHQRLGAFDWVAALSMLRASVARSCRCETVALTDAVTDVGAVPAFRYETEEHRLMLWILEVSLAYLQSPAFDRDTVFVSPDSLVVGDLRPYFSGDLTLLVRTKEKYKNRPILNAVQWWPIAARGRLIAFYTEALARAKALPDNFITWGADSEALRTLIAPIASGLHARAGLQVCMREAHSVLFSITNNTISHLDNGRQMHATVPIIDFKGIRKLWMQRYFEAAACA